MTMTLLDVIDYNQPAAIGLTEPTGEFRTRRLAVRAVAIDHQGRAHLLHVTTEGGYFKLPGGGVEPGETYLEALHREVLEELGLQIEPGGPIGRIVQFDQATSYLQESLCYHATITGGSGQPQFTAEERANGFSPVAYPTLAAAIAAVEALTPAGEHIQSIKRRELAFLKIAQAQLASSRPAHSASKKPAAP